MNIEKLAREAGFMAYGEDCGEYRIPTPAFKDRMKRFADLVLEEAAKLCDMEADDYRQNQCGASDGRYDWKEDSAKDCAAAIRALKDK